MSIDSVGSDPQLPGPGPHTRGPLEPRDQELAARNRRLAFWLVLMILALFALAFVGRGYLTPIFTRK